MDYDRIGSSHNPVHRLIHVGLSDTNSFMNVTGLGGPFAGIGEGDLSEVPGALEALMQDAEAVAHDMIREYGAPLS